VVTTLIPPHERRILEAHIRKVPLRDLALVTDPLDEYQNRELKELIRLRMQGLPLQYLTGSQDFFGREFYVNTSVLVPRPETEGLVELAINELSKLKLSTNLTEIRGLDLGTGSGCIAATLALEILGCHVIATDCCSEALGVAAENLRRLRVNNVTLLEVGTPPTLSDYQTLGDLDFIISNPPYLVESDEVATDVRHHEPESALYAPDGQPFLFYEMLIELGHQKLKNDGVLAFEVPHERADEILQLVEKARFGQARLENDLTGRHRYCVARKTISL